MPDWMADNRDYLFLALASTTLFGALEIWLRRRSPRAHLPWFAWPALIGLLAGGWFLVDAGGRAEGRRIREFLQGVAPTYAQELMRMGHANLTLDTPPDDPGYVRMIEATRRWKAVNPVVSDIYTFRKIGDEVRFMVASETDYNRDGVISGQREQGVPLGQPYPEADAGMLLALEGRRTFSSDPVEDEWGVWVSAQSPLLDRDGRIEGAVGVDYPAASWMEAIAVGRQRMIWLLAVPVLILGFTTATTGALRAEIAARQGVETQLRESEARLLTAIDSIPFDFWVMDEGGRYVLANASSRGHWGELAGKTLAELSVPADTRALWERNNRRAFAGEVVRGEVYLAIDGKRRCFHNVIAPVRVGDRIAGILGLNVDLTERVNMEEALRASERRFAQHVRHTPLAVIEWDMEFNARAWNPAAERIFGFKAEEVLGQNTVNMIVPEGMRDRVCRVWEDVVSGRGGVRSTNENLTKDGRVILCDWYNTPLFGDDGRIIGVASHCEDITARRSMEEHLRQSQKIESLGQLAAGVAHEFNNLLTPMLLRLEMLRHDRADDVELLDALRSIQDAIDQAAQLNQRILAVGRRSIEKREMLALNLVVDDTLSLLRPTLDRRIGLDMRLSPALEPLRLDRAQIAQVIVNLTLNARDAVMERHEAGRVRGWMPRIEVSTASVQRVPPGEHGSVPAPARACQRLTVADNGAGMTPEVRARVFEPFYTTKAPNRGTGLGLAVVWNVVKNLDGWIEIESRPGEGAAFHVYFPVPEPSVGSSGTADGEGVGNSGTTASSGRRILLVDDNTVVASTMNHLLTREGHSVTYAETGEEAWRLCTENPGKFDLVVTDQNMPKVTGVDLIRRLRSEGLSIRVVMVSGYLAPELLDELDSLGVSGTLGKPFTRKDLLDLVENALVSKD